MAKSFGEQIKQFALSVDIIDSKTFEKIEELIKHYVTDALKMNYFEFMTVSTVVGSKQKYLKSFWGNSKLLNPIFEEDQKTYKNQTAMAFHLNKPLWIVSKSKNNLSECGDYIDLWSKHDPLPKYELIKDVGNIRTSIAVPVALQSGELIGVLDFEAIDYMEKTAIAEKEILNVAESISIILSLREYNISQSENTISVINSLSKQFGKTRNQNLSKPKLFFAFSDKGDKLVIEIIKHVLHEYSNKLTLVFWDEFENTGNIISQMTNEILSSSIGICYLSEIYDQEKTYKDNYNVVFEAGMFYALCNYNDSSTLGWIPIRENNAGEIPFDFSTERIIFVDRRNDGEIEKANFTTKIKKRIDRLIENGI